jgi:hypothetical protein
VPPATAEEAERWQAKVAQASFIERSRLPEFVRGFFAHNVYVLAVKPEFRDVLGRRGRRSR